MKKLIIGGNFGENPKASGVMKRMAETLDSDIVNGGTFEELKNSSLSGYDLSIWSVNIDNGYEKIYPKKDKGSVLICTKVIHGDRTDADAVGRIFKMRGNAVIAIHSSSKPFRFKLMDALGNVWTNTTDLDELAKSIIKFYNWTSKSIRIGTQKSQTLLENNNLFNDKLQDFININKVVADYVENGTNARYFGNLSTRCKALFPSMKSGDKVLVSKRNVNKKRLEKEDMILVSKDREKIIHFSEDKPSVDTPIQLELYKHLPNINFMIHGHAYIEGAPFTKTYCPCGDIREVNESIELLKTSKIINLVNHGFLITAENIEELKKLAIYSEYINKKLGEEKISF